LKQQILPGVAMSEGSIPNPQFSLEKMDTFFGLRKELEIVKSVSTLFRGVLLDIGCGRMPYRTLLTIPPSRVERYIGLDLDNPAYQQESKPDISWDGKTIPLPDASVDCGLATSVFEHILEPVPVMREIRRVMKPDGVMLFTVPFIWPLHDTPGDYYRYTPFALNALLKKGGFQDVLIRPVGGWNAALAQMLGLWICRSPLSPEQRSLFGKKFLDLYRMLIESDQLPEKFSSQVIFPGIAGLVFCGAAPADDMLGFHKRGLAED